MLILLQVPFSKVLAQDSIQLSTAKPLLCTQQQFIAPVALLGAGLACTGNVKFAIRDWRNQQMPHFSSKIDGLLAFSPIVISYSLDALGVPARNDLRAQTLILAKAELIMFTSAYLLKTCTNEMRPDGSTPNSFPSSHTAQAFLGATLLSQEFKDELPWMPYAAYTLASSVACLRIANNRHYISDVLVGASLGILSQKLSYWTHQYKWHQRNKQVFKEL
jgi:membrane-associated phospholipid phosphatase